LYLILGFLSNSIIKTKFKIMLNNKIKLIINIKKLRVYFSNF